MAAARGMVAARGMAAPDGPLARAMTVSLPPADALERILDLGLDGLEPRSVGFDRPLMRVYHEGKVFYERTSDGVVLWRRPAHRWFRGALQGGPYPDVLDVRIAAVPRGARIEMRWRTHPITALATRWHAAWMAVSWSAAIATVVIVGATKGPLLLCVALLAVSVQAALRLVLARRMLHPLLPQAYAVLAPYELGAADAEGSVFRVPSARGPELTPSSRR